MSNLVPEKPARLPRISLIGTASWNQLTDAGTESGFPGGTSVVSSRVLSHLGAKVTLRNNVGDDELGRLFISSLLSAGIGTEWVIPVPETSTRQVVIDPESNHLVPPTDPGTAELRRGDQIDIAGLFGHDLVLMDLYDMPLLRFLIDLPAHTLPGARLFGTLAHIASQNPTDAFDLLMRHDAVIGTPEQFRVVTNSTSIVGSIEKIRRRMRGENLRTIFIQEPEKECSAFTADGTWHSNERLKSERLCQDDIVTASIAFGLALRWSNDIIVNFAATVANLTDVNPSTWLDFPSLDRTIETLSKPRTGN